MDQADTFLELRKLFFEAYQAGRYADAVGILQNNRRLVPEPEIYFNWLSCAQALGGQTAEAILTLENALAEGIWWPPALLRDDSDYASLLGLPEFEAVLAYCTEKFETARLNARPQRFVFEAAGPKNVQRPLLLSLHGRGDKPDAYQKNWAPVLNSGWNLALLGSSQVAGPDVFCWDDAALAAREVQEQARLVCQQVQAEDRSVFLAGFSQGAGLAARLVGSGSLSARGFFAVAPAALTEADFEALQSAPHLAEKRAVILAGTEDTSLPEAERLNSILTARGMPCLYTVFAGLGHEFPADFEQKMADYLRFLME